jgi:chromosome transmission fidelity protein 1
MTDDEQVEIPLPTPSSFPFPYPTPYPIQIDLMRTVFEAIEQKKIAIVCPIIFDICDYEC